MHVHFVVVDGLIGVEFVLVGFFEFGARRLAEDHERVAAFGVDFLQ